MSRNLTEGRATPAPATIETELSRDLGLVTALAIGVGTMIAAGIFTLSGLAVGYVGSAAIASFLMAAVVALFTALTYCEFTSIYPQSGEGYLYARETFAPPLAYLVGWCLLLGYASSCGFYIASLSSYFNEFVWHSPLQQASGLAGLAALTLLNIKGTKESGTFQVVITAAKIVLLLWFCVGGLPQVSTEMVLERFSTDILMISSTAALVFITFFGFSAIAASAGEVRNPTKTIPRAIFLSMGITTVLYTMVVLVIVAADLDEYSEAAMGTAAVAFLGPVGGMVIVGGALFSMISASNASILAGSRVALSMAQLGHLPREIGAINRQTRTPVVALLLVGGAIGSFALALPLETLAHFANCVLLTALVLVNAALIVHRRKFPDMERPFRVPLVPLLPMLGILANIYLLTQIPDALPVILATTALLLGFVGFIAWKGTQMAESALPGEASKVALERATVTVDESRFRVLVPVANPATVEPLMRLATAIAGPRDGEIVVLRVALVPEQVPPAWEEDLVERERQLLEQARRYARDAGIPVRAVVRLGHDAGRAILETSRVHRCNLIVLGWKGYTSTTRRILGETTDKVVEHARTDILLAKLVSDEPLKRLLLPSAGGEHANRAGAYAANLAAGTGGELTLCTVLRPDATPEAEEAQRERLAAAQEAARETGLDEVHTEVLRGGSVIGTILKAGEEHDAIVVGAAGPDFWSFNLFGTVPEQIARDSKRSVLVVKRYAPLKALVRRVMND